ncbi:thioredoxin 1 [Nonlabens dokdonensis]|jgi:thioredoxin 1|uniref:Thioredoxin 1 n=2 Tax=Nonlabens dokdonensis TaxID=328515 RepID=A0ABX5PUR4_9FLAO|nr:thioredoxin domain-containing protein [Nonlabens dokdonensis]AGC78120.1 putative thioredoxin [Nonlabens dokdonensis DSW-6]PZX37181.1 thioredoxin 1 [Nonlabens dokdonensis]
MFSRYLIVFLFFSALSLSHAQIEINDDNAEEKLLTNNDRLILVDFYATWCGPCKKMDPILKELSEKYAGRVDFYKIDVDKNQVDDALGVTAMPTYFFIKNSTNLESIEGMRSKAVMEELIEKYMYYDTDVVEVEEVVESTETSYYNASSNHGYDNEFSISNVADIWDSSRKLNSLAWHIYLEHDEDEVLYKGIEIVERSIELDQNYHNTDTLAALYFKTGKYKLALKKAKEAIKIAKRDSVDYSSTTNLMNEIIDQL